MGRLSVVAASRDRNAATHLLLQQVVLSIRVGTRVCVVDHVVGADLLMRMEYTLRMKVEYVPHHEAHPDADGLREAPEI